LALISLFLSPGGGAAELKTERNLIYNVSYGVNPHIISALWECPPPAAAKRIYRASKSQKSLCDF
jgi:hypothetical protein